MTGGSRDHGSRLSFAAWCIGLWLVWFGLAGRTDVWEIGAGAVVSVLVTLFVEAARGTEPTRFHVRRIALRLLSRVPQALLRDAARLTVRLGRNLAGRVEESAFRTVPFAANGGDVHSSTERTLVVFLVSLLPNSYALGVDRERGTMSVHELIPGDQERLLP